MIPFLPDGPLDPISEAINALCAHPVYVSGCDACAFRAHACAEHIVWLRAEYWRKRQNGEAA